MNNLKNTRFDRLILSAKNHRLLSILLLIAAITVGVATFTDAIDKVWNFLDKRILVNKSSDSDNTRSSNVQPATQVAAAPSLYTVSPGVGLPNCRIGDPKENLFEVFGKASSDDGEYVSFRSKGVQARIEDGKISALFFYFRNNDFVSFPGSTKEGISKYSKPSDVIKIYGDVSRVSQSTVSKFGAEPGAVEFWLPYSNLGIHFTFYNDELYDFRIVSPR